MLIARYYKRLFVEALRREYKKNNSIFKNILQWFTASFIWPFIKKKTCHIFNIFFVYILFLNKLKSTFKDELF